MKVVPVVLLVVLSSAVAWAAPQGEVVIYGDISEKPAVPASFRPSQMPIGVNSVVFFVMRANAAGYTLAERARIVDMRITEVLSRRISGPIAIKPIRGKPTIYVGPVRIVTVYPQDAAAAGAQSPEALAQAWAAGLAAGLARVMPGAIGPSRGGVYTVALNNCTLFRLHDPNGFKSLRERGAEVERRVTEALSARASSVETAPTDHGWGVFAAGKLVVEATVADAAAKGMTPQALASAWANNLKTALGLIAGASAAK